MEEATQNIDWIGLALRYALGVLGIIIFSVWKVREHLSDFSFKKLIKDNKMFWLWSFVMITLVLLILTLSPETAGALKSLTSMDVSNEPAGFLLMGWSLSALANSFSKKKLDKKVINNATP